VSTTGVSSRRRRRHNAAEAKSKRQRKLAIGGVALLAVVLVIQLPRILGGGGGGDSSATPAAAVPAAPAPAASGKTGRAPRFLNSTPRIDPFGPRSISDAEAAPVAVAAPAGARDPFADNTPAAAAAPKPAPQPYVPKTIVIGTPRAGRAPTTGYIVILASVPENNGKRAAEQIAGRAASKGIDGVQVIQSSTRKSLRAGFYAVYVGLFKSPGAATSAATRMHSRGYGDAYIRQLVRY
jgi:hypothetical protein